MTLIGVAEKVRTKWSPMARAGVDWSTQQTIDAFSEHVPSLLVNKFVKWPIKGTKKCVIGERWKESTHSACVSLCWRAPILEGS